MKLNFITQDFQTIAVNAVANLLVKQNIDDGVISNAHYIL